MMVKIGEQDFEIVLLNRSPLYYFVRKDGGLEVPVQLDERRGMIKGCSMDYHLNGQGIKGLEKEFFEHARGELGKLENAYVFNGIHLPNGFPEEEGDRGELVYHFCRYGVNPNLF